MIVESIVAEINQLVKKQMWLDMTVMDYDGYKLTISGAVDLSSSHYYIDITFSEVNFMSVNSIWHSNTDIDILSIANGNEYLSYREKNAILNDYILFRFVSEDGCSFFVAAKEISYKIDKDAITAPKR